MRVAKTSLSALAGLTMLVGASQASAANLITNGSFELGSDGLQNWSYDPGVPVDLAYPPVVIDYNQASTYPTGAFGEAIPTDNAVGSLSPDSAGVQGLYFVSDIANPQTISQLVDIVAGQQYQVGFSLFIPQNGANNINGADITGTLDDAILGTFFATGAVRQWVHYSTTFTGSSTGKKLFSFQYNSNGVPAADFVVDRVYLAAVPEPATWAMFILGFGLVGYSMRRRKGVSANFSFA